MSPTTPTAAAAPWWRLLTRYHWYVFALAALGWLFDTMDGMIFTASRSITMADLLAGSSPAVQIRYGGYVTSLFILGWATGGLIFGIVGDKWGRAKTMALTIFIYAAFTGLSGLARTWEFFGLCRFLTGLGVGGEFAAGAALVAEVMPEKARAQALGMLQSLSAFGNILGATLFGLIEPVWGWPGLYVVGAFPALLAVIVRLGLKEPERWVAAKAAAKRTAGGAQAVRLGSMSELFTNPQWRRHTLVGLGLALAGIIALWGAGFWTPELIDSTIPAMKPETRDRIRSALAAPSPAEQTARLAALDPEDRKRYLELHSRTRGASRHRDEQAALSAPLDPDHASRLSTMLEKAMTAEERTRLKSRALILQQLGAFAGMFTFGLLAARIGRRWTFLLSFILGWGSVFLTFLTFQQPAQVWYLWPILGFGVLMPFGGYALYFPELFPTRLRTTGTGTCYNTGRFVAAMAPLILVGLAGALEGKFPIAGFRLAAVLVSTSYLLGFLALIWAPETKDRPLPEDERALAH